MIYIKLPIKKLLVFYFRSTNQKQILMINMYTVAEFLDSIPIPRGSLQDLLNKLFYYNLIILIYIEIKILFFFHSSLTKLDHVHFT